MANLTESTKCGQHDLEFAFYCSCRQLLCMQCLRNAGHRSHSFVTLECYLEDAKREYESDLVGLHNALSKLAHVKLQKSNHDEQLVDETLSSTEEINGRIDGIVSVLESMRIDLNTMVQSKAQQMDAKKENHSTLVGGVCLRNYGSRASGFIRELIRESCCTNLKKSKVLATEVCSHFSKLGRYQQWTAVRIESLREEALLNELDTIAESVNTLHRSFAQLSPTKATDFQRSQASQRSEAERRWKPTVRKSAKASKKQSETEILLCIGGSMTDEVTGYVLASSNKVWLNLAPMKCKRTHAAAVTLNGKVLVTGGCDKNNVPMKTAELFHPEANRWTDVSRMGVARRGHALVNFNKTALAIGGADCTNYLSTVECFEPGSNKWSPIASLNTARAGFASATLPTGVLVAGGHGKESNTNGPISSCELLGASNQWQIIAPLSYPRVGAAAAAVADKAYVFGGCATPNRFLNAVEQYDSITNSWNLLETQLRHARWLLAATAANGRIYLVGGLDEKELSLVECFDPNTLHFSRATSLERARERHAVCALRMSCETLDSLFANITVGQ